MVQNPENIVFNDKDQGWGQSKYWECASRGHIKLLEFMLNCENQVKASADVPENLHEKCNLLHRASYCEQVEVVGLTVNRGTEIHIRDAKGDTVLDLGSALENTEILKSIRDKGFSINLNILI
jgi:hypothetical protein